MKQETGKKSKKLLWLIIALAAIVAVAGVLLGIFWSDLFGGGPADTAAGNGELYWNVDRMTFVDEETGMSNRVPNADGVFEIRFAHDGQIVELKIVGDKKLVNFIDTMDVMGLVFDANGMIVDAVAAKDVATEVVKDNYVSEVGGGFIRVNSAMTMTGMSNKIKLTENTKIFDVSVGANPVGQVAEPKLLDCVTAYADADGNVTTIFITKRVETGGIYYIFETQYDSTLKETKRVPDENGVYTFIAAHEGEQVELKCRDKAVMSDIDSVSGLFGLKLDDEGYVVKKLDAASAMLGIKEFVNYTITELDGDTFTATRFMAGVEQGNTFTGTLREDADVFIVEDYCTADFIGQRTELQMGDRVDLWTDLEGNPMLLTIVSRKVDSPMYWNISMSYNWTTRETSRTPDENGYYHVSMVVEGKQVELRTKDKALMTAIDEKEEKAVGLKLKGDIIQEVYNSRCVCGLWGAGTNRYITATSGNVIQLSKTRDWTDSANYVLPKTCNVYDVTGYYGVERGTKTTVQKFDCVTAFQNESGELTDVFIIDRYAENSKIYYNYNRITGRKDGITTRKIDADGYYVFDMACEGKQVQVKTKNAEMATWIDSQWPNYVALEVKKDGTIKNAYPARAAVKGGHQKLPGNTVKEITKDGVLKSGYRNEITGIISSSTDLILAKDYKVYNCSLGFEDHLGEKTKLKVGDQFATVCAYPSGEVVQIFVIRRQVDSPLYWHYQKYAVSTEKDAAGKVIKQETTRPVDKDGYYVFELIDNGKIVTLKTKDKALATQIDSNTQAFCLTQDKGIIKKFYGPTVAAPDTTRYGIGGYDVMEYDEKAGTIVAVRNRPQASDYGAKSDIVLREDVRIINVDTASENFGKLDKVELGDRIVNYRDPEGRTTYLYIQTKGNHKAGHVSYCEHCDKEVFWEPFLSEFCRDDTYAKTTTFHYYVIRDQEVSFAPAVGHRAEDQKNYDIVLDLNGNTYTGAKNAFSVYTGDTLTILDTAGGGKLTAKMVGAGAYKIDPGVIVNMGTVNLYSGTICPAEGAEAPVNAGALFNTGSKAVLNIYGGTVTGGKIYKEGGATFGGNIHLSSGATLNMYGGVISNGDAGVNGYGGNVNISTGSKANIYGGKIVGGKAANGGNISIEINAELDAYLNIYGGEITGGIATNQGGNLRVYEEDNGKGLKLNITGGKILGGTAKSGGNLYLRKADAVLGGEISGGKASTDGDNMYIYTPDYDTVKFTGTVGAIAADSTINDSFDIRSAKNGGLTIEIDGATIVGEMVIPSAAKLKLAGATKIDVLKLPTSYIAELGEMKAGAEIGVSADGIFTTANDNAEAYKAYFFATAKGKYVTIKNGALTVDAKPTDNKNLVFNGKIATCPVCLEDVEWTELTNEGNANLTAGHYYLSAKVTKNGGSYLTKSATGTACIHLNGQDVELSGGASFLSFASGNSSKVNVMGNGNVSTTTNGGTLLDMGYGGSAELFGGTYYNKGTGPVALMYTSTLTINNGVTVSTPEYPREIKVAGAGANLVIKGGNIAKINVMNGNANIGGTPVIGELVVESGKKVTLGALDDGASIGVNASGIFTNNSNQAADYKKYFTSKIAGKVVEVEGNALTVIDAPINNDDLVFEGGKAYCAACGTNVEWTALELNATNALEAGKHYYLTGNGGTSDATFMTVANAGTYCIHLNGNDITCSNGKAVLGVTAAATVNIMGNGNVSTTSDGGCLAEIGYNANVNFLGGTYINNGTGNIFIINTATVKFEKDVILGSDAKPNALKVQGADANVTINGSTVKTINFTNGKLTLNDTPTISNLNIAEGKLITLGTLKSGADITVNATGAFTAAMDNAASYKDYFKAADAENFAVKVVQKALTVVSTKGSVVDNLVLGDGTNTAWCAVCGAEKEWTPLVLNANNALEAGKHYYLTDNAGVTEGNFMTMAVPGTACVHLNGKNITCTGTSVLDIAVGADATTVVNIMGTGKVATESAGQTMYLSNDGTVVLHCGTYKNTGTGVVANMVNSNLTVGEYAKIEGEGVKLDHADAVLNVEDGQISKVNLVNGYVQLTGAPVIEQLYRAGGALVVNELTDGTSIGYAQAATASNPVAVGKGAYAGKYFHAYEVGGAMVNAKNGNLTYSQPVISTEGVGEVSAYCAVCDAVKTWVNAAGYTTFQNTVDHMYLAGDLTKQLTVGKPTSGYACIHLNGKTLSASTNNFQVGTAGAELNIMGNGKVEGNRDTGNLIFNMYSSSSTINVYAKLTQKTTNATTGQIIYLDSTEVLNLYDGGSIDLTGARGRAVRLLHANAQLNIHGGKIIMDSASNAAIELRLGTVNFTCGEILAANSQYPVYVEHDAGVGTGTFNMSGGKILSAAGKTAGDVFFNGEGTLNITGGTFTYNPSARAQNGIDASRVKANADGTFSVIG